MLSIEAPASSLGSDPKADECLANEYQSPKKHDECHAILRDVILERAGKETFNHPDYIPLFQDLSCY